MDLRTKTGPRCQRSAVPMIDGASFSGANRRPVRAVGLGVHAATSLAVPAVGVPRSGLKIQLRAAALWRLIMQGGVLIAMAGCAAQQAPPPGTETSTGQVLPAAHTQVMVDLFSGRPNPLWSLTDAETKQLHDIVNGLPGGMAVPAPESLGYRGFVVSIEYGGPGTTYTAYAGVVQISMGTWTTFRHDPDAEVQRFLLETGKPHLAADLYDSVKAAIADQ